MSANAQLAALLRMHNCEHAYLDVGTNIGVQIRKLYQPHLYPDATIERLFSVMYGEAPRCTVCTVGLEPNPRHEARLVELERRLVRAQAPVVILRAAAATEDGTLDFYLPAAFDNATSDWGASLVKHKRTVGYTGAVRQLEVQVRVEAVDLARVLTAVRRALPFVF